jgi:putative ABC transport system ATP-binding protein
VASTIYDMPTGIGGSKLPAVLQERAGFSRAAIKRPDILILDKVLASHDPAKRQTMRDNLRKLLPDTTMLFLEDGFNRPNEYDLYVEISKGRIVGMEQDESATSSGETISDDMRAKLDLIARTPMFRDLDIRNQRLLAFSARRLTVQPGQDVFRAGDPPDAVYLCVEGEAELHWPNNKPGDAPIAVVQPGRLMGDLSVILDKPREAHMIAVEETVFLRIGAEEYRAVIEGDKDTALKLLRAVAGNLANTAKFIQKNTALMQDLQVEEIAPGRDGFHDERD